MDIISTLPYPDEFCRGHIGRIGRLNDIASVDKTIEVIRGIRGRKVIHGKPPVAIEEVAHQCHIPPDQYVNEHTLFSFVAFTDADSDEPMWHRIIFSGGALTIGLGHAPKFCTHCAHQDLLELGTSYWRRTHQFPGMRWCAMHDTLLHVSPGEADYAQMPHHLLANSTPLTSSFGERYHTLPGVVVRFHQIVDLMARHPLKITRESLRRLLWQHLCSIQSLTLNRKSIKKTSYLSDLVVETFPIDWLSDLFPYIGKKRRKEIFHLIDGAIMESCSNRPNGTTIALFLAMHFETSTKGFDYLKSSCK